MKDSYVIAKLVEPNVIRVFIFSTQFSEKLDIVMVCDGFKRTVLKNPKITSMNNLNIYECRLNYDLPLGHDYHITLYNFGSFPLDINETPTFKDFDERYNYDGELGFSYTKEATEFRLWAPLASAVRLILNARTNNQRIIAMNRTDHGVYRVVVEGDCDGFTYNFSVTNSGMNSIVTDPYAKASTPNGGSSVVFDFEKFKIDMHDDCLPKMNSYADAIIYEGHVRDLTVSKETNIVHKGQYLGMVEPGRKTINGDPAGFDYISNLGITHLQLLPIYDYETVDETHPFDSYNWGYDPQQYMCPEGSYASNVFDNKTRITDLLTLISKYHEKGIRIIMDVVYNHVYNYEYHNLEKIVPNYYFRRRQNGTGKMTGLTGCGNDIASEKAMVRKLIIDCTKWWSSFYHIDGYRFDLMGIIDAKTLNLLHDEIRKIDEDAMFYGEGWNMSGDIPWQNLGNADNYRNLPDYAFFNDSFRDSIKGPTFEDRIRESGYALGNIDYATGVKFNMAGSCFDYVYPKRFDTFLRSINYVECHDNGTLFDKIDVCHENDTLKEKLERIKLVNSIVMLSMGIPFFHAGQEIGLSKGGNHNSYNAGDSVNQFDYSLLLERADMVKFFKDLCVLRKEISLLHETSLEIVDKNAFIENLEKGIIKMTYTIPSKKKGAKGKKYHIFFNPSYDTSYYYFHEPLLLIFNNTGDVRGASIHVNNLQIPSISVSILLEENVDA